LDLRFDLHGADEMICINAGINVSLGNHEVQNVARKINGNFTIVHGIDTG